MRLWKLTLTILTMLALFFILAAALSPAKADEIVTGTIGDGEINLYTAEYEDITITTGTLNGAPVNVISIEVGSTPSSYDPLDEYSLLPEEIRYPLEGGDFKHLTTPDPTPR